MNEYAAFAERAWRELTPSQYAQLTDPKSHFSDLGEEAASHVQDLLRQIAGPDRPGESYLEKVGRLNAAKMQAEETVRAELLTPPEDEWETSEEESPHEWLHQWQQEKIQELQDAVHNTGLGEDLPPVRF